MVFVWIVFAVYTVAVVVMFFIVRDVFRKPQPEPVTEPVKFVPDPDLAWRIRDIYRQIDELRFEHEWRNHPDVARHLDRRHAAN